MSNKMFVVIGVLLGVVTLGMLVWIIVLACNGATIDAETAWTANLGNPASPVHQVVFH